MFAIARREKREAFQLLSESVQCYRLLSYRASGKRMQRRKIKLTKFSKDAERRAVPLRQLSLFSRLVLCTITILKPNSITLAISELAPNMFEASSEMAPNQL